MILSAALAWAVSPTVAVDRVVASIRQAYPACTLSEVGPLTWSFACPQGTLTLFFDRLSAVCATGEQACGAYVEATVASLAEQGVLTTPALDRIVPAPRPHTYTIDANSTISKGLSAPATSTSVVSSPLTPNLDLVWMFDYPAKVEVVTEKALAGLLADEASLGPAAMANCERLMRVHARVELPFGEVVALGDYGGCLWFLPGERFTEPPERVAFFTWATASTAIVATADDASLPCAMLALAATVSEQAPPTERRLPLVVFARLGDVWVPVNCRR